MLRGLEGTLCGAAGSSVTCSSRTLPAGTYARRAHRVKSRFSLSLRCDQVDHMQGRQRASMHHPPTPHHWRSCR